MHMIRGDGPITEAEHLFQQRLAVASNRQRGATSSKAAWSRRPIAGDDFSQTLDNFGDFDRCEVESLAARQHGDRDLVRIGGAEDELHVLRRLFQRLQQRVEGLAA